MRHVMRGLKLLQVLRKHCRRIAWRLQKRPTTSTARSREPDHHYSTDARSLVKTLLPITFCVFVLLSKMLTKYRFNNIGTPFQKDWIDVQLRIL